MKHANGEGTIRSKPRAERFQHPKIVFRERILAGPIESQHRNDSRGPFERQSKGRA